MDDSPHEVSTRRALRHARLDFHDHAIPAALGDDLDIYVPIRVICDILGIDARNQIEQIAGHRLLRKAMARLSFVMPYGEQGATRLTEMYGISNRRLHSWLMTISADRVAEPARDRLFEMQEELAELIYAWMARPGVPEDILAEQEQNLPEERKALYDVVQEAHDALNLVELAHARIDEIEERIASLETRWAEAEGGYISKHQRAQYLQMVKIIAEMLIRRKDGDYNTVNDILQKEFEFQSYKNILAKDFPRVRSYCREWFEKLARPGTPIPPVFAGPDQ